MDEPVSFRRVKFGSFSMMSLFLIYEFFYHNFFSIDDDLSPWNPNKLFKGGSVACYEKHVVDYVSPLCYEYNEKTYMEAQIHQLEQDIMINQASSMEKHNRSML